MEFKELSRYFERIEQESSRLVITQLLVQVLKEADAQEAQIICYLSLGQLYPPYIGMQFNMAEKSLLKVAAQLCGVSLEEIVQLHKKVGDIGALLVDQKHSDDQDLSVLSVYQLLCQLEKIVGTGSQDEKSNALLALLQKVDPLSSKYIVRIILGKLRLGFSDMTLIDAFSWMQTGDKSLRKQIEHAYNICVDIGLIAYRLKKDGMSALEHMQIQVGIPIRPAAAERLPTAQAIVDKLGVCVAQPKLDGFRLQVHIKTLGDGSKKINFFSRNVLDMSAMFPDLTAAFAQLPVHDLICEGEAIVYDVSTQSFLPFQETVKRKRKHGIEDAAEEFPLQFFIFDLLYCNGESLLFATHAQRRQKLCDLLQQYSGNTIYLIQEKKIEIAQDLENYFRENVSAGLEGLVVKRPDALYTPGARNFNWIKLKRQEEGHLEDTLDCVVLGYYTGEGKRAQFGIGAFLVGVFNPQEDRFETVAKVGTGLTDKEWIELKTKADAIQVGQKPHNVTCAKELFPDVWVDPTFVVMIRADEITMSPSHTAGKTDAQLGYALRFPRFMGYSDDKNVSQATTVEEVARLYDNQFL